MSTTNLSWCQRGRRRKNGKCPPEALELKDGILGEGGRLQGIQGPMGILIISHQIEIAFKVCDIWYLMDRVGGGAAQSVRLVGEAG